RDLGFHLIVARRTGGAGRSMFEPPMQTLNDMAVPAALFSGDRREGRLAHGVASQQLPQGRALLVRRGKQPEQLQVPWSDEPAWVVEEGNPVGTVLTCRGCSEVCTEGGPVTRTKAGNISVSDKKINLEQSTREAFYLTMSWSDPAPGVREKVTPVDHSYIQFPIPSKTYPM